MKRAHAGWAVLLCIFFTTCAYSQTNAPPASVIPARMMLPHVFDNTVPLTGFSANETGSLLSYGIRAETAYNDNVLPNESSHPIADYTYSVQPSISLDQNGNRLTQRLTYSPGFTIYQHTSALNDVDQHLTENLEDRLSPNLTLSLQDNLDKSSNAFSQQLDTSQPDLPLLPISTAIALYADQFSNTLAVGPRYQFGENSLIGADGGYSFLHFTHPSQVVGLDNNSSIDASSYYLHRFTGRQYLGAIYQYTQMTDFPPGVPDIHIHIHAVAGSYAIYFTPSFQAALIVGPQHIQLEDPRYPQYESWKPWIKANVTWRGKHTALTGDYSRTATTGGGLEGIFEADTIGLNGSWQPTLRWTVGVSGGYLNNRSETPFLTETGGHGYSFSAAATRRLSEHWNLQFQYDRLNQRYPGIAAIAGNPLSNRESIAILYSIKRRISQ